MSKSRLVRFWRDVLRNERRNGWMAIVANTGHVLAMQRVNMAVKIVDLRTNTQVARHVFYGGDPGPCPAKAVFSGPKEGRTGTFPTTDSFIDGRCGASHLQRGSKIVIYLS
jgi:hypothetical protein